jgi:hypothetical protein
VVRTQMKQSLHQALIALLIIVRAGPVLAAETEEKEPSLTEVNKQLTNPVSSIWSLTAQFNNFIFENAIGTTTCCSSGCC